MDRTVWESVKRQRSGPLVTCWARCAASARPYAPVQHILCPGVRRTFTLHSQVLAHLKAETAYTEAALADTQALQEALYKELRGRIQVWLIAAFSQYLRLNTGNLSPCTAPLRDGHFHACTGCAAAPSVVTVVWLGTAQEADQSAPQRHGPYFYYSRTVEGGQYRINCRRPLPPNMGTPSGTAATRLIPQKFLTGRGAFDSPYKLRSMAREHCSRQ